MTPELRRGGAVSAVLHGALLLALLLTLKPPPAPPLGESAVTMEFAIDPAQVQRAQTPSATPAPAPAEVPTPDLPSLDKPRPTPIEAPPPPPPPPPPAPTAAAAPAAPAPPPAAQFAPPAPVTVAPVPAPLPLPTPPLPVPPMPPPPVPPPPAPRPAPERPNPAQRTPSTTSQPNPAKSTADDSKTLEATLEKYRSQQRQTQAPRAVYNPPRGGAVGGGSPDGIDNAKLSAASRGAIGDRIRECWTRDAGAKDADQLSARLKIITDPAGVVREATVVQPGAGPAGLVFAERARRAALDPQCNPIPLPRQLLGQNHTFEIVFKP